MAARSVTYPGTRLPAVTVLVSILPELLATLSVSPGLIAALATSTCLPANLRFARLSAPRTYRNTTAVPSAAINTATISRTFLRSIGRGSRLSHIGGAALGPAGEFPPVVPDPFRTGYARCLHRSA